MKMRWIIGIVACFWMAGLLGALWMSQEADSYRVDRVTVNDVQQKMRQEYQRGGALPAKSEGYDVLWNTSVDYQEKVNDNIVQGRGMADITVDGNVVGKVCWDGTKTIERNNRQHTIYVIVWSFSLLLAAMVILLVNIYLRMIRPFHRLKTFSERVAMGELDFPLVMEKNNYFGAFTTSFDVMREELKRAKEAENEAQRSKRELVAQLSHDIKTPISSISANCELLQMQITDDNQHKKLDIIQNKIQVIEDLTSSLFQAALEELNELKVEPREELVTIIPGMFQDVNYYDKIHVEGDIPECMIACDPLRLLQVIDNVISNSYKYAGTDIHVSFSCDAKELCVRIADEGAGVSREELPMICEKFYRGENGKGIDGSGLGLYISRKFMLKMGGRMELSCEGGFVVRLYLALI